VRDFDSIWTPQLSPETPAGRPFRGHEQPAEIGWIVRKNQPVAVETLSNAAAHR
jgi:hypothetical protein